MKNFNLLLGLGFFAASMTAQAQSTIFSLGFEDSEKSTANSSKYAITPGQSAFGDWVNPQEGDSWNEQSTENPYSGEYCFCAENGYAENEFTWNRGFKIANLPIKENKSYRISFMLKTNGEAKLSSWLSIGIENFDKSICTADGSSFGIDGKTIDTEGEWRRVAFTSFYSGQENILNNSDSWVGGGIIPEGYPGAGQVYKDYFNGSFPDEFFFIVNAVSNDQTYYIDDIKIDEDVAFAQATYYMDAIRLDFGYNTSTAALAKENGGNFMLPTNYVNVTVNGEQVNIASLEAKEDGYVYIFLGTDETPYEIEEGATVKVSFTPDANCPIKYVGQKRPSSDYESEMAVLAFSDEVATYDVFDVLPASWSAPTFVSSIPEDNSFDLEDSEVKTVTMTYNKELNGEISYATLTWSDNYGQYEEDLTNSVALSDDKMSLIFTLPALDDADYMLTVKGVANVNGFSDESAEDVISFSKGQNTDGDVESVVIFKTDFDNEMTDGVPRGWLTDSEAGVHKYGFNDEAQTSQYNYGWGGTPGGGGARLYQGFSGDFNKALYWCSRGTTYGVASYGELIKDYLNPDGSVSSDCPEGISLYLEPRKYQISFQMAAWKSEPIFRFTLEDLEGNVYAKFNDFKAYPNMNGSTGKVTGSLKCQTDFTVDKEGYYVLKFAAQDALWQEFLLANVNLITMPSKSAYYKNMLEKAVKKANDVLAYAGDADYAGETQSYLRDYVNRATTERFTQGSVVEQLCKDIEDYANKLDTRYTDVDNYFINRVEAQGAIDNIKETNPEYANNPTLQQAEKDLANYPESPLNYTDDELSTAVKNLSDLASLVNAIPQSTSILTWGASQAVALANLLGANTNGAENLLEDDREVINGANDNSKKALYSKIASGADLSKYMTTVYDMTTAVEEILPGEEDLYDEDGHPVLFKGINLSAYIYNAHLYRQYGVDGVPGWDITLGGQKEGEEETSNINIAYNVSPSASSPVVDAQIQIYGETNYDFAQTIENLPAGIYNVVLQTRTPKIAGNGVFTDEVIYYNAQDEYGTWDKYIYAIGDGDNETLVEPFAGASGLTPTIIQNVVVKDGKLTMGAHEFYVSGQARTWNPAEDAETDVTSFWTGTSYVDYANIYFVAPLEGYDYGTSEVTIQDITNMIDDYLNEVGSVTIQDITNLIDQYLAQ